MKSLFIRFSLLLVGATSLLACKDDALDPAPGVEEAPLILPRPSADSAKRFLDYQTARLSQNALTQSNGQRPVFEFTVDFENNRELTVDTLIMYKSFRTGGNVPTFFNAVEVGRYGRSQIPFTFSQNSAQLLAGLNFVSGTTYLPVTPVNPSAAYTAIQPTGTAVVFTFEYILTDGRRIVLTPHTTITLTNATTNAVTARYDRIGGTLARAPYAAVAEFR